MKACFTQLLMKGLLVLILERGKENLSEFKNTPTCGTVKNSHPILLDCQSRGTRGERANEIGRVMFSPGCPFRYVWGTLKSCGTQGQLW